VAAFDRDVRGAIARHNELTLAVYRKVNQKALETALSEQFALSLLVRWETFLSDLVIAYIGMDANHCCTHISSSVMKSVTEKFGKTVARFTTVSLPRNPSGRQVRLLLDPGGWNVTASKAEKLANLADSHLPAKYAIKFHLDAEDSYLVDYALAVRNYLGHRSRGARDRLSNAVSAMKSTTRYAHYVGSIAKIGPYLKAQVAGSRPRVVALAEDLLQLASRL
jgi:hypothetical protein